MSEGVEDIRHELGELAELDRQGRRRSPAVPSGGRLYVAVVDHTTPRMELVPSRYGDSTIRRSGRPLGDWAAFTGTDKDAVIREALAAVKQWSNHDVSRPRYRVLIGELTSEVRVPLTYEEVPL